MDFTLARQIYGEPWFMDAYSFQKYFPMLDYFRNGGKVSEGKKLNSTYLIDAQSNEVLNADISAEPEEREQVISVTRIDGPITKHGGYSHSGTRRMAQRLTQNDQKENVIGHILEIESGGGSANAIPEMADAIQNLSKPIVTYVDGIMASAAMYIGSYTNHIVASREDDLIGSIGTMIEFTGTPKQSEDQDGIRSVRIYADDSFNKNKEFEEAINNFNFKPVKEKILNPHNDQFKKDIKSNRPKVRGIELTGEIFHANEVVGTLIDSIGPFSTAVEKVKELSNNVTNKSMNLQELKSKYPELHQSILDIGVNQERTRCKAWMNYSSIDPEAVKKGITEGLEIDADVMTAMQVKGMQVATLKGTKEETIEDIDSSAKGKEDKELTDNQKELAKAEEIIMKSAGVKTKES
jgi:protease-4